MNDYGGIYMAIKKALEIIKKLSGGEKLLNTIATSLNEYHFEAIEVEGYDKDGEVELAAKKAFGLNNSRLFLYNLKKEDVEYILGNSFDEYIIKREKDVLPTIVQKVVSNVKEGQRTVMFSRSQFPILDFEIENINRLVTIATAKLNKNTKTELIYGKSEYTLKTNVY